MIDIAFRSILMRRVKAWRLDNLDLNSAECFVLDMLAANIPHHVMDQVLLEIAKKKKMDLESVDNHNNPTLLLKNST